MRTPRAGALGRAVLVPVVGAICALPVATSAAAGPVLNEKLVTSNFIVHYTTAVGSPDAISPAVAQIVGNNAEKALATEEAAFGFDAPLSGPDARIDVYVYEFRSTTAEGIVHPVSEEDQSESVVLLRTSKATDRGVTAHEVFHVLQNSVWVRAGKFLQEATAVWAQQRAFPGEGFSTDLDPTAPLDCFDDDVCANAGYQSWSFFEFLAERDGPHIVREIFDQAKALQINRNGSTLDPVAALAAISAALAPHHRMLGPTFRDFALANINGDYSLGELRDAGLGYLTDTKPLRTGASTGTLARRVVTINHLATNYLPVAAGGGKKHGRCRKATLRLDIAGPKSDAYAGYALGDRKSKTIAIANGRGHLTLHSWSTCGGPELILALVNSATSRDDLTFMTTATLTVP